MTRSSIGSVSLAAGLLLFGCHSSKRAADAGRDGAGCPYWGITSETGGGWTVEQDMCLDVWPAAASDGQSKPDASPGVCPKGTAPSPTVTLTSKPPAFGPAEGRLVHCLQVKDKPGGMALRLLAPADMSRFLGGRLVFQLAADNLDRLVVGMASSDKEKSVPLLGRAPGVTSSAWTEVAIPLSEFAIDLATMSRPFEIGAQIAVGQSRSFCVDNVHLEALCGTGADASGSALAEAGARTGVDAADASDAPRTNWLVPPACIPAGETAEQQIQGILLEAKQDVRLDVLGEAKLGWWGSSAEAGHILAPTEAKPTSAKEGLDMMCATINQGAGSAFVYYESPRNFSALKDGYLEAELFANADVLVGLSWKSPGATSESRRTVRASDYVVATDTKGWRSLRIPLCVFGADLANLVSVATFTVEGRTAPTTFCADAIRFRKATATCSDACTGAVGRDAALELGAASMDTHDVHADLGVDRPDDTVSPMGPCPPWLVPSACLGGENPEKQVQGILLECKQDVRLDEAGEAKVGWWGSSAEAGHILAPTEAKPALAKEGRDMLCATVQQGAGSAFVYYENPRDFSALKNGYLEVELFADADVLVGLSWKSPGATSESRRTVHASDYVVATDASGWRSLRIPLCVFGADLAQVVAVATFTVEGRTTPTTFCADAVRFRKPSETCSETCSATVGRDAAVESRDAALDLPDAQADLRASGADQSVDRSVDLGLPTGACPTWLVPSACTGGEGIESQLQGILLECKQDVRLDEAGEAKVGWWGSTGTAGGILAPADPKPTSAREGADMVCANVNQGAGSVFVYYESPRDFSLVRDGYLETELFADADVLVGLSWKSPGATSESRRTVHASDYVVATDASGWRSLRIPLCAFGADLSHLVAVATFAVEGRTTPTTFCVDAVRFRKPTDGCFETCAQQVVHGHSLETPGAGQRVTGQ